MRVRSREPELLDLETPPRDMMARVAGYLTFVNRWLGGTRAVAHHFRGVRGPVRVLDVGAGAGDILRSLTARFPRVSPVAFDLSAVMLSFADGLPRIRGDVHRLPFRDRSVDYVVCSHFFHHLGDDAIVTVLREFDRIARRGIVINDLIRSRRALFWIRLFTLWANPYVKADGPQSVRRGFRLPEIEALARRAGLSWLRTRRHFGHRFTLAGTRPDG